MKKKNKDEKENIKDVEVKEKTEEIKTPEDEMKRKRQNKQVLMAIILMVVFVAIILLVPFVIKNYINKFTYINLDFTKNKIGEVTFYNTVIPMIDPNGTIVQDYELDLRSDPRKLEYIEANISTEELKVIRNVKTYISVPSEVEKCSDNVIAMANFARFLGGFAQLDVKGASTNESYAKEFNTTYATCKTNPNNTVIVIQSGNKTKIEKTGKNCYELTYANCEVIQVTEKFDVMILKQYMDLFERKSNNPLKGILG